MNKQEVGKVEGIITNNNKTIMGTLILIKACSIQITKYEDISI